MQEASDEFVEAVAAHRTWVPPRLRTDWTGAGYRGDGTIDDLSGQMSDTWEVDHTLDDGYPDAVTFVSGTSVPELSTGLSGRSHSSPTPTTTTSTWTGSVVNGASTASGASLTVPAGVLRPGDVIIFSLSLTSATATISADNEGIGLAVGPTADSTIMQTAVYGGTVDQTLADNGRTFSWRWSAASRYSLVGASIGMRDGTQRPIPLTLVAASQTNETGSLVTGHTTPTVTSGEAYNVAITAWNRGTTQSQTWTMAVGDSKAVEAVGASGTTDSIDAAIGYGPVEGPGSFSRTATTSTSSNATMAILVCAVAENWQPMSAVAYWSPLRTDSPVHGYDRDVAPVTLDVGLVTSAGREYARVFTGQMVNTPVRGGRADLQTISATRLKLMRLIQPPAFASLYSVGLYATWPISYNLFRCGVYPGPRPRDTGTAWHVPMHGSAWPVVPADNVVYSFDEAQFNFTFPRWITYEHFQDGSPTPTIIDEVPWMAGPYVSAPDVRLTASYRNALYTQGLRFERSAGDAFSQAGHAGRLEMWVKGDATDVNNAPGGSGTVTRLCSLWLQADAPASPYVQMGIKPDRYLEVKVYDGSSTRTLTSASPLPSDGAWHFVGCAYDLAADKLWLNMSGTVTGVAASMVTTNLPATDIYTPGFPVFLAALPVAELTFTVGSQANADNYPLWRDDASFAPTAKLVPSRNKLVALAEPEPREAWVTITEYAKAELASVRLTETDEFQYLPLSWWVRDEQQVIVDDIDTARNAAAFDVDLDPTKIRNSIKVSYTETQAITYDTDYGGYRVIYELPEDVKVTIPTGTTVIRFAYTDVGILPIQTVTMWDNFPITGANLTQVTLNDVADGTGIYATSDQVEVEFVAWDAMSATLRFRNKTTLTWYLVNNGDFPALIITGARIETNSTYAVSEDAGSIAERGIRALDVTASILQDPASARRLARNVKMALRRAVPTVGIDQQGVEVIGNPLRQPGDLVTAYDAETGVDGVYRLRGVHHKGKGADYRQAIIARKTFPIMIIGQGRIGESLIGPASE